ncbi:L,D-transpeptidase family protein [Sulfurovum sp. CS9]|uniref:L,D-transpeptidase family protein n=1 Tax=Sulfurovum sp. CS9 TaxID=3391146 RepID=UPI0039E7C6D5
MRIKILLAIAFAVLLSGCVGTPDSEGWRSSQKNEFLKILKTDKYMSICNQQALYQKVKESKNSQLMSKLLVAYTENLANGCIINASQKEMIVGKKVTTYGAYPQKVSDSDIKMKLKAGQSIEQILKPYVPEYDQFSCLTRSYNILKKDSNTSESTLRKIRLNIERVKLMKPGLGKNYALINIPEFVVRIIEDKKTAVAMGVVVGKRRMKTPVFSEDLQYITLNPQWSVPDSIARNEVIPDLLKDPNYLKKHRMVMRSSYDLNSKKLTPDSVDLKAYVGGKGPVPFKFIEVPSVRNGLGRVKFIFPNHHSVYMHDTQSKHLFKRKVRTYSHGCVRLEKPNVMLDHISKHYTSTSAEDIKKKYDSLKTHYVKITKRLPVHTAYLTTYTDQCSNLLIFPDIYGFDKSQKLNF